MNEQAIQKRFGVRVRRARQACKLTQEEVADAAELDRSYVGQVERGERNISLVNIHKIARALHVQPSDLVDSSEWDRLGRQ